MVSARGIAVPLLLLLAQDVPQPRFQSGVELLRLDVTALDGQARPVPDLGPSDFRVEIDGRERRVLFAYGVGPGASRAPVESGPAAALPSYGINTASPPGRAVVFVVDLESIKAGYEKPLLDTAAKLVDGLGPNDAVALMPIPGRSIDLTRDHRRVADALRGLRGTTRVPFIRHYFTISEATAWENRESRVMREVIERECQDWDRGCPAELGDEIREMLRYARMHVQTVLSSVAGLARGMQKLDAPKTIVLVSGGLPFETESLTWFTDAQQALTRAGIRVYTVQVSQPDNDAGNLRRPGVGLYQSSDVQTGLANVATMAGGATFAGVGTAAGVFDRLRAEIRHAYVLGVETTAADADGKPHEVRVTVRRPGITLRSPREVVLGPGTAAPLQKLASLLAQPVDVADLPVAAAVYTVRGDESDTLKVIVAAEFGLGLTIDAPVRYAITIRKDAAAAAFETNDVVNAPAGAGTNPGAPQDTLRAVTAAQLAPGRYRLRIAAVDAAGRGGTLELPLAVGLRAAADVQTSELILGVRRDAFAPAVHVSPGDPLAALLELYATDPARFDAASVSLELRRAGTDAVIRSADAILRETSLERRRIAEGTLDTSALEPGEYLVSAIVSLARVPAGKISRTVRIGTAR